jgi:hypothetical protein
MVLGCGQWVLDKRIELVRSVYTFVCNSLWEVVGGDESEFMCFTHVRNTKKAKEYHLLCTVVP